MGLSAPVSGSNVSEKNSRAGAIAPALCVSHSITQENAFHRPPVLRRVTGPGSLWPDFAAAQRIGGPVAAATICRAFPGWLPLHHSFCIRLLVILQRQLYQRYGGADVSPGPIMSYPSTLNFPVAGTVTPSISACWCLTRLSCTVCHVFSRCIPSFSAAVYTA